MLGLPIPNSSSVLIKVASVYLARVFKISAVARQGVQELLNAALNELENYIEPESDEIEYFGLKTT